MGASGEQTNDPLLGMVGQAVVLDTGTPIVYLGTLAQVTSTAFVLEQADMHDCRDGHAQHELYVAEAHRDGVKVNRHRIVVMRSAVISVSCLADVAE